MDIAGNERSETQQINGALRTPAQRCGGQYIDFMRPQLPAWLSTHWPSLCLACQRWPAQPLCNDCIQRFHTPALRCTRCALRLPPHTDSDCCGSCLRHPPPLVRTTVAVDYHYPWTLLLTQWKFRASPALSRHLARWFAPADLAAALSPCTLTIPIPLSAERLRERGYNQALLLAHALACPQVQPHCLRRVRDTPSQARQNRADRLRNLRQAFAVPAQHSAQLQGQHVLLVDDVITTGATLHAAARTLLAAGAAQVSALALARTP